MLTGFKFVNNDEIYKKLTCIFVNFVIVDKKDCTVIQPRGGAGGRDFR